MAGGYMGKILWVDLAKGKLKDEALDEKMCREFIGGYGLGARIIYSRQKGGVDPLGPDAILGILTGPFTGTPVLSGTRYVVVGKSPLTGTWGDANSGGDFGPYLKYAGYDGVFLTGISPKPVYVYINNGKAELRDASHLWGKDTFETEDALKTELGNDVHSCGIGPAGEKGSLIAGVMNNKGRAAGRSGLGAVMGSKKVKAIAVTGNMRIPMADEAKVDELRKKYMTQLTPLANIWREYGTPALTAGSLASGDAPIKNWGGVAAIDFPNSQPILVQPVMEQQSKKYACFRCPFGCGGLMKDGKEYEYQAGAHKPEYETLVMFGSSCLNNNLESIIKANDICNRYGIDTISAGATIAFTIECYENGLLTKKDTDGIEMTWGNHRSIVAMTEKLAKREDFGAIIADGVKKAAGRIGKGSEKYAMHIQGEELPAHDPKLGPQLATAYRMDATPGRHTQGSNFRGRGQAHKNGSDINHIYNSAGMCMFMFLTLPTPQVIIPEFVNAITGWNVTYDELLKTGERIANIRHTFNLREGLNPLHFDVPGRVMGNPPLTQGPLAGKSVDEKALDSEYLAAMDWDLQTTKPSKQKLQELGLEDVIGALHS